MSIVGVAPRDVLRWIGAGLLLVACGADDETVAPPRTAEPTPAPHTPGEPSPSPASHDAAETRALSEAEAFVRAQGYADMPPTVPDDEIVHEGIEGSIEMRRNTLVPGPVSAARTSDGWVVRFRYVDARYAGRGRVLHLREGQPPRFVHQDILLGPVCRPVVSGCGCAYRCARSVEDLGEARHRVTPASEGEPADVVELQRWCFDADGRGGPEAIADATRTRCLEVFYDRSPCAGECIPNARWLDCSERDCGAGS